MLEQIISNTIEFLDRMPKALRKKKGQFFTSVETAVFMASIFDFENLNRDVSILDPGCGTGILSSALIDRLITENKCSSISLDVYETDEDVIPILRANLEYLKNNIENCEFEYHIFECDYLLSQGNDYNNHISSKEYDLIIGNPPYMKIRKDTPVAVEMKDIVHGAPNLYFLFAAMSLFNLKSQCELVYIIPRSWTSGAYFKAFRNYFLKMGKIKHVHLFLSRMDVFSRENVLQETMIVKMVKDDVEPKNVTVTSNNSNFDFSEIKTMSVPYSIIVSETELYVYLPTTKHDIDVIEKIHKFDETLPMCGLRMKTGVIVDFREQENISLEQHQEDVPIFYAHHIRNGEVSHIPDGEHKEWVSNRKNSLRQRNKNYLFVKRFSSKEEARRIQCGIYLKKKFSEYEFIGTQNKINYIDCDDKMSDMSDELVYGLYVLFNSTLYDDYYRVLNGSTQVNSTEINNIPIPQYEVIEKLGRELLKRNQYDTATCDKLLEEVY